MALSVVDVFQKILPKTNCKECGYMTCLAFASMVVSEKLPLKNCPHLTREIIDQYQVELDEQHRAGVWTRRDMAKDALEWAKERSSSMNIEDLPDRIGGTLIKTGDTPVLELPYFSGRIHISSDTITTPEGGALGRWEQVFIYNHMAQGGSVLPGENWKGLEQFPNTVSKIKSMREHVEEPLIKHFTGKCEDLRKAAFPLSAKDIKDADQSADVALFFRPLPRVPVSLLFWDEDPEDGFDARVKLLFDDTITEHLDIESILFLSERLRQLLCGDE
jgi:uncharacterized protein DUF3786/putative Fe-S cluster protein